MNKIVSDSKNDKFMQEYSQNSWFTTFCTSDPVCLLTLWALQMFVLL